MKIGINISPRHRVPPDEEKILAPWALVNDLVNGLVKKNHEVFVFGAQGSRTSGILCDFNIKPYPPQKGIFTKTDDEYISRLDQELFLKMVEFADRNGINLIHMHQLEFVSDLLVSVPKSIKFVFTLHDPLNRERQEIMKKLDQQDNCYFVSISNSQRNNLIFRFADTVYNGIDPALMKFKEDSSDYMLFMGRLKREKGLHNAIKVALSLNLKLEIGVAINHALQSNEYFNKEIKPYLKSEFIGEPGFVDGSQKILLYQEAKLFLFPIEWEEPFGLVMIEAMACGSPVVAYARGSVPEVIVDGVTGFIVNEKDEDKRGDWIIKKTGVEGLKEAVNRIYSMDEGLYKQMRLSCRKHVEENFSVEKMVEGYERVYHNILRI